MALVSIVLLCLLVVGGVFAYYWVSYGRMIDDHLAGHVNQTTARLYAAPEQISVGEKLSASDLVSRLQRAGYNEADRAGAKGWYAEKGDAVEVHPEQDSYFAGKNALRVEFSHGAIQTIALLDGQLNAAERADRAGTTDQSFRQRAREAAPRAILTTFPK